VQEGYRVWPVVRFHRIGHAGCAMVVVNSGHSCDGDREWPLSP
jgi:hypothetical protein